MYILIISIWSMFFGQEVSVKKTENKVIIKQPELYETIVLYIKSHEGLRLEPYQCQAGKWTIGWGHVILPHEKYKKITLAKANEMFLIDFNKRFDSAKKAYPKLERRKLLVLTASSYNLGTGIFLNNNSVVKAIKKGKSIKYALLKYCLVNGKFNQVISNRRKFECNLYDMPDNEVKFHNSKYKKEVLNQIKKNI